MIGQTLGAYTIERELGRGGMGAVYLAVHAMLGRKAAVKLLRPELSRDPSTVQRFFTEARAASAIKHPSIVEIYDFGVAPDGAAYIVMELLDGESLATRLARLGRLPVATALVFARQIATALAAAHRAGIVHRDLKPDNAFLVADPEVAGGERVKLLDFGIAKLTGDGGVAHTTTGAIMGTPHYMSPEQCEGSRAVDHRADLYSLGCMLFQMITNATDTAMSTSAAIVMTCRGRSAGLGLAMAVSSNDVSTPRSDVNAESSAAGGVGDSCSSSSAAGFESTGSSVIPNE